MKKYTFNIPIYHGYLIVFVTNKIKKLMSKYDVQTLDGTNDWGAGVFTRHNKKGQTEYILAIRKDHLTMQTIAHESLHIAYKILNDRDIVTEISNEEVVCYLLGWVAKQLDKIKQKNK